MARCPDCAHELGYISADTRDRTVADMAAERMATPPRRANSRFSTPAPATAATPSDPGTPSARNVAWTCGP